MPREERREMERLFPQLSERPRTHSPMALSDWRAELAHVKASIESLGKAGVAKSLVPAMEELIVAFNAAALAHDLQLARRIDRFEALAPQKQAQALSHARRAAPYLGQLEPEDVLRRAVLKEWVDIAPDRSSLFRQAFTRTVFSLDVLESFVDGRVSREEARLAHRAKLARRVGGEKSLQALLDGIENAWHKGWEIEGGAGQGKDGVQGQFNRFDPIQVVDAALNGRPTTWSRYRQETIRKLPGDAPSYHPRGKRYRYGPRVLVEQHSVSSLKQLKSILEA